MGGDDPSQAVVVGGGCAVQQIKLRLHGRQVGSATPHQHLHMQTGLHYLLGWYIAYW